MDAVNSHSTPEQPMVTHLGADMNTSTQQPICDQTPLGVTHEHEAEVFSHKQAPNLQERVATFIAEHTDVAEKLEKGEVTSECVLAKVIVGDVVQGALCIVQKDKNGKNMTQRMGTNTERPLSLEERAGTVRAGQMENLTNKCDSADSKERTMTLEERVSTFLSKQTEFTEKEENEKINIAKTVVSDVIKRARSSVSTDTFKSSRPQSKLSIKDDVICRPPTLEERVSTFIAEQQSAGKKDSYDHNEVEKQNQNVGVQEYKKDGKKDMKKQQKDSEGSHHTDTHYAEIQDHDMTDREALSNVTMQKISETQYTTKSEIAYEGDNNRSFRQINDGADDTLFGNSSISTDVSNEHHITKQLLDGSIPFDKLPPLTKKVVRIFVSSTFSDTKEERNAFMEHVYPKVAKLCRDRFGLEFQVVDMRWGVPEQASDNHSTTELCIQEIKKCQQVSVGPNFVALLGNKYGYRPIPSCISIEEFAILRETAQTLGASEWRIVEEWYMRDNNNVPAKYILEAISAKLKEYNNMDNPEGRKAAKDEWNKIEVTLTETLRTVAEKAHSEGKLYEHDKHKYFMSVTEDEVHNGILNSHHITEETSLCIIRTIPDIEGHVQDPKAPKFIDIIGQEVDKEAEKNLLVLRDSKVPSRLTGENVINISIEWAASGGNVSLETADKSNCPRSQDDHNVVKHKKYLEGLCDQFYQKLVKMISTAGIKNKQVYNDINTEVLQHLHFSKQRCEVFEGREEVMKSVKSYLNSRATTPLTIHGNSGCGKTSVMAKVMSKMKDWTTGAGGQKKHIIRIVRFLGTTPQTSNVQGLLNSVCRQLAKVYDVEWEEPERFPNLVSSFHHMLTYASKETPLLILLDSIDQLMPTYDAFNLKWLPKQLPPHVKLILSTIDEGYLIKNKIAEMYDFKAKFIAIESLGGDLGITIINKWLSQQHRCISQRQQTIVLKALAKCSLPLFARIAYNQISTWRSFDVLNDTDLEGTIKGAINKLYQQMEVKLGVPLVKHSLAYFTAARYGLSEVEMEHLLSLDDELLNDIYKFWKPPIRRIPPLLWTRVRNEINNYVVERAADGLLVMNWYHRQFIEATRERYLANEKFRLYIHTNLTDFFSGKWGGDAEKPFEYTEAQKARFGLQDVRSKATRKVPIQPYCFTYNNEGKAEERFNERKLSELPWHMLKSSQTDILLRDVFFSYEWLFSKLKATSATALIQEIELCMAESTELAQNKSLQILVATLHLVRPYITKYPESLSLEITGRLAKYVGSDENVTRLLQQCDTIGLRHCPLVPVLTCFQVADLGLRQNINVRTTTPIEESGGIACTQDFKTMYIVDYDELGKSVLSTWEIETGEKVSENIIQKESQEGALDFFLDCTLTVDEKYLLVLYRLKYARGIKQSEEKYNWKAYSAEGHIDIVDVKTGQVNRTIKEYLYKDDFYNAVLYQTQNWVSVRFGWKVPLIALFEDHFKSLTEAHYLSKDENTLALIRTKKDMLCKPTEEEENKLKARSKTTLVRDFKTKALLAELERSEDMSGLVMTNDEKILILADFSGKLQLYGIRRIGAGKKNVKKIIATLTVPFHEKIIVFNTDKLNFKRVILKVSPNDQFVMAVYQGREGWEAFLWDIEAGTFVGRVTTVMPLRARYPVFSYDSSCIVVSTDTKVQLYSCSQACKAREYDLGQNIRDLGVSVISSDVAVLLNKDVVFLKAECEYKAVGQRLNRHISASAVHSTILINKETSSTTTTKTHPNILFDNIQGTCSEDCKCLDMDELGLLNSARSQKRSPVDSCVTPDGSRAVQLLLRLQLIDAACNEIKYSPIKGDIILRPYINPSGSVVNEEISLGRTESAAIHVTELKEGDRIVGEGNKVKFRAQGVQPGQIKIMMVPSVITISGYEDRALKRLHRITVYNEAMLTVSDLYLVTTKKTSSGDYINIYDLHTAHLVATHLTVGGCTSVAFFDNNRKVATTSKHLVMKIFGDIKFVKCLSTLELGKAKGLASKRMTVREILCFPRNPQCLVLRMSEEGFNTFGVSFYIHVNVAAKAVSPVLSVKPKLEDISKDGSLGIDARLALYSLNHGCIIKQIPYHNTNLNMQLQARISEDNKYIVFVDKQDDTLHVVRNETHGARHLVSCHTHAPLMPSIDGFTLRHYGKVIVIRGSAKLGLFLIRETTPKKAKKVNYGSELKRAQSLVPEEVQPAVQAMKPVYSYKSERTSDGPLVQDFLSSLGT